MTTDLREAITLQEKLRLPMPPEVASKKEADIYIRAWLHRGEWTDEKYGSRIWSSVSCIKCSCQSVILSGGELRTPVFSPDIGSAAIELSFRLTGDPERLIA